MPEQTIAAQVADFNTGFTAQIGPTLSAVFAGEQQDLVAAGAPTGVITVGSRLPAAVLLTPSGERVALADVLAGSLTVVVLYRGAWCPYCNLSLKHYQAALLPELTAVGAQLVAISPQTPEASEQSVANGGLEYAVLSDPSNSLAAELGLVTAPSSAAQAAHTELGFAVADSNADSTAAIPFPTVLVVDADRVVRFVDVHVDYTTRTEVPTILDAVEPLVR
ncbi:peroxiredoxin-like family protein [Curtobacterium sp. Leaf261]|uniref:peroxiredoxin-like family protein n=1 Tax=Curtobacterium sp. Leaf261 TaxID=1736311 RepID=UPI0006F2A8A6|nr:peroxiredoxin-like family protein [Curtobacterium sp. Leaf261]KQO63545.1 peroxiredoxin [Curtobacterium sp. Leaf261]